MWAAAVAWRGLWRGEGARRARSEAAARNARVGVVNNGTQFSAVYGRAPKLRHWQ